ncbi:unnamed protein product, partial [marine sediment metagenome]
NEETFEPAQSICICGKEQLLKLANGILDYYKKE